MDAIAATADDAVQRATATLDSGELAIVPGDLCYLLVADALDDLAIERLYEAKHRGADRGLLVLVSGYEDIHHVAYGGPAVRELADAHWPGPTELALKPRPWIPDALLGSKPEVRVCAPANAYTRALAKHFGPIAAASARRAGAALPLDLATARAGVPQAALAVDAHALPGGEAKVIPAGSLARS